MWKMIFPKMFWWFTGVVTGVLLALDIGWARGIDMSRAGVSLWVFLAVGAFIILLQLVPAIIVVTSLIAALRKEK